MFNLTNNPICSFIATVLIVLFLLTFINLLKFYPCNQDMLSNFVSNFFHVDIMHLLSNLYGLYVLSSKAKHQTIFVDFKEKRVEHIVEIMFNHFLRLP